MLGSRLGKHGTVLKHAVHLCWCTSAANDDALSCSIGVRVQPVEATVESGSAIFSTNVLPNHLDNETVVGWIQPESPQERVSSRALQELASSVRLGLEDGLCNGPQFGYPVSGVAVEILPGSISATDEDADSVNACLRAAAARAVKSALSKVRDQWRTACCEHQ